MIEPFREGACSLLHAHLVLRVDSAGSVVSELEAPFSWSNLLVRDGIGVLEVENGAVAFDVEAGRPCGSSTTTAIGEPFDLEGSWPCHSKQQIRGLDWTSRSTVWTFESD